MDRNLCARYGGVKHGRSSPAETGAAEAGNA
jgi:hypothetical protein